MHASKLAAKVAARNAVNADIRFVAPQYLAAMAPFVGQKIVKCDGDFTKAFLSAMPKGGSYWRNSGYSAAMVFIRDEQGPGHHQRQESVVYLGDLTNGVLVKLCPFNPNDFRIDYTSAEVEEQRRLLKIAECEVSKLKSKLNDFGTFDQ